MPQTTLIFAYCHNPNAKGDFSHAGSIARDLAANRGKDDPEIVLTSTLDGIANYEHLYGKAVDGHVTIAGQRVRVCPLELFDGVKNEVVTYIEANRCKLADVELVKRVISPKTKFLFLFAANQGVFNAHDKYTYKQSFKSKQPGLYEHFDDNDLIFGTLGLGLGRLGLAKMANLKELPQLTAEQLTLIPKEKYGYVYLNGVYGKAVEEQMIAQYIQLSGRKETYILVGGFTAKNAIINDAIRADMTAQGEPLSKTLPKILHHDSVSNNLMRHMAAGASGDLVVSTGTMSTLEVMHDGKLPYYQNLNANAKFVTSYLLQLAAFCSADSALTGNLSKLMKDLSATLFADKPLSKTQMTETHKLLAMPSVTTRLIDANQQIVKKASGTVAGHLLGFLSGKSHTQLQKQCVSVCYSLRKAGETNSPVYDQALRRAAAGSHLFELKVLIKAMLPEDLNKRDNGSGKFSAMHWAVISKFTDGVILLAKAGAELDIRDAKGKTPLHYAVANGDKPTIKFLVDSGASVNIADLNGHKPAQCCKPGVLPYLETCLHNKKQDANLPAATI